MTWKPTSVPLLGGDKEINKDVFQRQNFLRGRVRQHYL